MLADINLISLRMVALDEIHILRRVWETTFRNVLGITKALIYCVSWNTTLNTRFAHSKSIPIYPLVEE